MEKFEFKLIKRIITANSKLFLFIRKMNEIITKFEEGKLTFIKSLIENYSKFSEESEDSTHLQPRRIFFVHCRNCHKVSKVYELGSKEDI
jgi:hypothetical protein